MSVESRIKALEELTAGLRGRRFANADELQSLPVSATAPTAGSFLQWNNTSKKWEPFSPPRVRVTRASGTGAQGITTATDSTLNFDEENYDTDTMHDNSTNNSRLTATTAGTYSITVNVTWAANNTGIRQLWLRENGSAIIAFVRDSGQAASLHGQILTTDFSLAAAEYVEARVHQDTGGDLDINRTADYTPIFSMHWIGPAP